MGTLVFQANLGGAVNLVGPNTASTVNFTLPSADGSSGQALVTNGSGTLSFSSFVSAAAGSNTQVQFNSSGAFAGSANLTFNGTTLTAANTSVTTSETLSYGTANGVAYLNGSKVVTTGTALTFDGTNLGLQSATNAYAGSRNGATFRANSANGFEFILQSTSATAGTSTGFATAVTSNDVYFVNRLDGFYSWITGASGNTEQMRLTSTGLGIGTSSPSVKLHVKSSSTEIAYFESTSASNFAYTFYKSATGNGAYVGINGNGDFIVQTPGSSYSTKLTLDSSGNLGLGVTPSAWYSTGYSALQVRGSSLYGTTGNDTNLASNAFVNTSPAWAYVSTGTATRYEQGGGAHKWYNAPSGTAGNAITWTQAMTLDASGNLAVGLTSPSGKLHVNNTGIGQLVIAYNGTSVNYYDADTQIFRTGGATERARIDSSGRLLLGTTSASIGAVNCAVALDATTVNSGFGMGINGNASNTQVMRFAYAGTAVGSIVITSSTTIYNTISDYRLKDNQQPLTGSGEFIDALQPKTWDWKADGSKGVGFIAHEVQEVSPNSVVGEKDGEQMQAMEYGSAEFIANIIAELQSLRKRVAQLEAK